jgi:hypothetical protein
MPVAPPRQLISIMIFLWLLALLVCCTPGAAVQAIAASHANAASPSDLTVEISALPVNPGVGEEVTVSLVVRNSGSFAVTDAFTVEVYVDPATYPPPASAPGYPTYTVFGLGAGETYGASFTHSFSTQDCGHVIYAWVDRLNQVAETDEENNRVALPICVGIECAVDAFESDDACDLANWIDGNASQQHSFCHATQPTLEDKDWVKFTVFPNVTYTLLARNPAVHADPRVTLYASCGSAPVVEPTVSAKFVPSTGGILYAKLAHGGSISGPLTGYELVLNSESGVSDDYEPDGACSNARDIVTDGSRQKHLFQVPNDEDWVRFQVQAGESFIVIADKTGSDVTPQITLFSSCDAALVNDSVQSATTQVQTDVVTDQTFYARVVNKNADVYGANAGYDLSVTASDCQADSSEEDDSYPKATLLALDTAQSHNVCPASDEDWFKFAAEKGRIYVVQTSDLAADADTVLQLYDRDGTTLLGENDDHGYTRASRIVWEAPANSDYFVRVRHHNVAASGKNTSYSLSVQQAVCKPDEFETADADNGSGDATMLTSSNAVQTHNFCADPLRTDLGDQDWLAFDAVKGGNYQIRTSNLGDNSDTVLQLFDRDGSSSIQQNDDTGLGRSAGLSFTATTAGTYYVQVTQYNSALIGSDTEYTVKFLADEPPPPTPTPTPTPPPPPPTPTPDPTDIQTLILVNRTRMTDLHGEAKSATLMDRLYALADHNSVNGAVAQVEDDPAVAAAYAAWTADAAATKDNEKANAVAASIRNLVMSFTVNKPNMRYVIIVGDDRAIPYRRVPDRVPPRGEDGGAIEQNYATNVAEDSSVRSALTANMVLTDDYIVDRELSTWQDKKQNKYELFLPDYATGRLIETPDEIIAIINTFLGGATTMTPDRALITGYDFVKDSAEIINTLLSNDEIPTDNTLISPIWTGDQLRTVYLETASAYELFSINGHATHTSIGTPDEKDITAAEIVASTTDLQGTLVFNVGCHGGLNEPGGLDIPQSFVRKLANYVGNTGYGWGGSGIAYSEALMRNFTRELLRDTKSTIGPSLVKAKSKYYSQAKMIFDAYDAKVLMQTTLFGLPMMEMTSGGTLQDETPFPSVEPLYTAPTAFGSLAEGSIGYRLPNSFAAFGDETSELGRSFDLDGQVNYGAGEPVQPRYFVDVPVTSAGDLRGAVFLGGIYKEVADLDPEIALADNEYVVEKHEPFFAPISFYPAVPFSVRTGASDAVVMSLGQYRSDASGSGLGVARIFDQMSFSTFHSGSPDKQKPDISSVDGILDKVAGTGSIKVEATDYSGLHRVVVAYDNGSGEWKSKDLVFDQHAQKWSESIDASTATRYFIQAVDNAGNVAVDDNKGQHFSLSVPLALVSGRSVEQQVFLPAITQ